jgi:hypothetical protein
MFSIALNMLLSLVFVRVIRAFLDLPWFLKNWFLDMVSINWLIERKKTR